MLLASTVPVWAVSIFCVYIGLDSYVAHSVFGYVCDDTYIVEYIFFFCMRMHNKIAPLTTRFLSAKYIDMPNTVQK